MPVAHVALPVPLPRTFDYLLPEGMTVKAGGPALDEKGNSIGGGYTLEYLSEHLNLHILDSADAKEA